jgi:hypothetical protein
LEAAHRLIEDASSAYGDLSPRGRQRLNQVFFTELRVSPEKVAGAELTDEYAGIVAEGSPKLSKKWISQRSEPPLIGVRPLTE